MLLSDLLDDVELYDEIAKKNVRMSESGNFAVLNYTDQCMRDKHWTPVTTKTRGLVITHRNARPESEWCVVARPWDKFFNYGEIEHMLDPRRWQEPVEVTDKYDGSLGIVFHDAYAFDRPRVATRGSLTSDQAKHAQNILDVKYPDFVVPAGWTMFFEIIYPENRIVLDYDGMDDLVFLGARDIETGALNGPNAFLNVWHGPRAKVFTYSTLERALAAPPRPNSEGMVIRFLSDGLMVKIKQEDYVNLHRLVTGLSKKSVWEWIYEGGTDVHELTDALPEEFGEWVVEVYYEFVAALNDLFLQVERVLTLWSLKVDGPVAQSLLSVAEAEEQKRARKKTFAAYVSGLDFPHPGLLYMAYEEKDWFQAGMRTFKPVGETSRFARSEDVA